jgi:hypothetical protein
MQPGVVRIVPSEGRYPGPIQPPKQEGDTAPRWPTKMYPHQRYCRYHQHFGPYAFKCKADDCTFEYERKSGLLPTPSYIPTTSTDVNMLEETIARIAAEHFSKLKAQNEPIGALDEAKN